MAQLEEKAETPELVESARQPADEIAPIQNLLANASAPLNHAPDNESNPSSAKDDDVCSFESPPVLWSTVRSVQSSHPMMAPVAVFLVALFAIAPYFIATNFEACSLGVLSGIVEIIIIVGLLKYQRKVCRVTTKLSKMRFEVSSKLFSGKPYSFAFPWEKLMVIRVQHDAPDLVRRLLCPKSDYLVFYFPAYIGMINLTLLSADKKETLFKAVARYAPAKCFAPEALTFLAETFSGSDGSMNNFTEIWMGEYKRKFQLSNHALLSSGTIVANRYSILMPLSNRANLSTYLVEDQSGKRLVLKELVESPERDASMQAKIAEQFMREASFLSTLNHPRICKIYDSFVEKDRVYIAMEHISGHNLREYVRVHGALSACEVVEVALQLAEILRYLHLQEPPVIHRDISPENLIFSAEQKQLYLIDFGAANTYASNRTATLVGKQSYMAPEQFRGKPQPASDVYGLGATLCFLLSGVEPEPLAAVAPPELAPSELGKIIAGCTRFESSQRASIEELLSSLRALKPTSESCI